MHHGGLSPYHDLGSSRHSKKYAMLGSASEPSFVSIIVLQNQTKPGQTKKISKMSPPTTELKTNKLISNSKVKTDDKYVVTNAEEEDR
jgi:hypothetical protein